MEINSLCWRDDKRGRPIVKDKKINVPRVVVKESILVEIEKLAIELNISRSEVFQRALEAFIIIQRGNQ